jgi:ankyrin repeat protein/L-ascorbate metabolism protein UlaG (beta-lactamase superfamily)
MTKKMNCTFRILIMLTVFIMPALAADIHEAAKTGDLQKVQELVKADPDMVNLKDNSGRTPLHWAARNDHLNVVKFLVKNGADVNAEDKRGIIPLYYSVWLGENYEIAECLVNSGADINSKRNSQSLLFLASRDGKEKIAELLVKKGADLNQQDAVGKTPLYISVEQKYHNIVELLLNNGAKIFIKDNFGRTPLHQSAIEGYIQIATLLLASGADVNEQDNAGKTPLYYAGKYGHEKLARLLKSIDGNTKEKIENFGFSPLLRKNLEADDAVIWYLGHAGWAVKTKNTFLIFDYWERGIPDQPLLANGRINPEEIKDLDVYVFSSHVHYDHYDEIIFDWEKTIERLTFIFGWQNNRGKNHVCLSPRERKKIGRIEVLLVNSPDANPLDNAFLVKADGIAVYHGGDYGILGGIEEITTIYSQDMQFLKENANELDIMFLASRLMNGKVPEFIDFSIETAKPRVFFPMHYQSSEYLFRELADEIAKSGTTTMIISPENRGDMYIYEGGKT